MGRSDDATRRAGSEERAAIVRGFLDEKHRTAAQARACAERLGISRSSFYRLARAYDHGASAGATNQPKGSARLDPAVERRIAMVLDRIGVRGRVADAHELVDRACRRLGLATPAKDVVRKRMLERGRDLPLSPDGPRLRFDETGLGMAAMVEGHAVLPAMSMIIHAPTGRVLAHRLDPAPLEHASYRLADALGLPDAIEFGRPRLKGGFAAAVFGPRLGGFLLRPRAAGRRPSKHYRFEIGMDEARRMVGRLVDEHNATRAQV